MLHVILALCLATGLPAQSKTFVMPPGYDARKGNQLCAELVLDSSLLPTHVQDVIGIEAFPVAAALLGGIAFRRPTMDYNYTMWSTQVGMKMTLSHGALTPAEAGYVFSANMGADATVVLDGTVDWPTAPPQSTLPRFVARVPFQRSFLFHNAKGKSLVLDYVVRSNLYGPAWVVDSIQAVPYVPYFNVNNWSTCKDSRGKAATNYMDQKLWLGGFYGPTLFEGPPNTVGIASLGTVGAGGKWNGVPLPIAIPGAPGCRWGTNSVIAWGFVTDGRGLGKVPPIPIPYDRKLVNQILYDQSAFLDAKANPAGIVAAMSMVLQIADSVNCVHLWRAPDPHSSTSANIRTFGDMIITEFSYY